MLPFPAWTLVKCRGPLRQVSRVIAEEFTSILASQAAHRRLWDPWT